MATKFTARQDVRWILACNRDLAESIAERGYDFIPGDFVSEAIAEDLRNRIEPMLHDGVGSSLELASAY